MTGPNILIDYDPAKFTIYGYCADCDHSAVVPRPDESMTIPVSVIKLFDGVVFILFEGAIRCFPIEYCRMTEIEWLLSGPKRP
jgi:hypothetical protein